MDCYICAYVHEWLNVCGHMCVLVLTSGVFLSHPPYFFFFERERGSLTELGAH